MPYDLANISHDGPGGTYSDELTITLSMDDRGLNHTPRGLAFSVASITGSAAPAPGPGVTYDRQKHEIICLWDFDDPDDATPLYALNMPNAWKNRNIAYGHYVGHVYHDGGARTVSCYAYEPATRRFGYAEISVPSIQTADEFYPGTQTIIFNPGGTADVSAYSTATEITTDWSAVRSARNALGASTYARILLASHVETDEVLKTNADNWVNFFLAPLDPDAALPVLNGPTDPQGGVSPHFGLGDRIFVNQDNTCEQLLLSLVKLVGAWDSTTETGIPTEPFHHYQSAGSDGYAAMLDRCEVDGFDQVRLMRFATAETGLGFINECKFTNWHDFAFVSTAGSDLCVIAADASQHIDALSGGPKDGLHTNHGPFRDYGALNLYLGVTALYTRTGWFSGTGGWSDVQHALRINTNGAVGTHVNVDRLAAEGAIAMAEQNNTGVAMNAIFDKVQVAIGSRQPEYDAWNIRHGGVTARNILNVKLDVPSFQHGLATWFKFDSTATSTEAKASPMRFHNITNLDLRVEANTNGGDGSPALYDDNGDAFSDIVFSNTVTHEPYRDTPVVPDAPIDMTTAFSGFVARDKGPRFNFQHESGQFASDVADDEYFDIPFSELKQTIGPYTTDDGAATDETYWLTNLGEKSALSHNASVGWTSTTYAHREVAGEIEVEVTASALRIWNRSGGTWPSGDYWHFRADRSAVIPGFNSQYDCTGMTVPLPVPQTGSAALADGDTGEYAYDDILLAELPVSGRARGAVQP